MCFATNRRFSNQLCDEKYIFRSNLLKKKKLKKNFKSALRQKADFQINSATKTKFFKIKFLSKNKFSNGLYDKK
jgi:hypothetical protein